MNYLELKKNFWLMKVVQHSYKIINDHSRLLKLSNIHKIHQNQIHELSFQLVVHKLNDNECNMHKDTLKIHEIN
jgi:hypothetical protein